MYLLSALLCGLIFGFGLTISMMINPNKIINFLDITGDWDPSLALVMLSALIVTWIGYRFVLRKSHPLFGNIFFIPEKKPIDLKLILGAAIFGIGWGASGYCPGPAITALGLDIADAFYFVIGMVISSIVYAILRWFMKTKHS